MPSPARGATGSISKSLGCPRRAFTACWASNRAARQSRLPRLGQGFWPHSKNAGTRMIYATRPRVYSSGSSTSQTEVDVEFARGAQPVPGPQTALRPRRPPRASRRRRPFRIEQLTRWQRPECAPSCWEPAARPGQLAASGSFLAGSCRAGSCRGGSWNARAWPLSCWEPSRWAQGVRRATPGRSGAAVWPGQRCPLGFDAGTDSKAL